MHLKLKIGRKTTIIAGQCTHQVGRFQKGHHQAVHSGLQKAGVFANHSVIYFYEDISAHEYRMCRQQDKVLGSSVVQLVLTNHLEQA